MTLWLPWAVDDPAPAANCGYGFLNIPGELADLSLRRGVVIHSSEGYWSASYKPSDTMKARGNSWGASIMQDGAVYRHRPRPTFVNWHAGGPAQNVGTDGIEMEGKEPWTAAQKVSLARVLKETRSWFGWPPYALAWITSKTQASIRTALLIRGHGSLWEHKFFDYTSCPSGRNTWTWLIPALLEPKEEEMPLVMIHSPRDNAVLRSGGDKQGITSPAHHEALHAAGFEDRLISDAQMGAIPWYDPKSEIKQALAEMGVTIGAGGGLTKAEVKAELKQALREGTE